MEGKRVCITGGTGFIGSHLAEALAPNNEVTCLDSFVTGDNGAFVESLGAKVVKCDVGNYGEVLGAFSDFDVVFHLAAMNRAQRSIDDPVESNRVNVHGTFNVLEACRKNGVPKCVLASSSSVYGGGEDTLSEGRLPDPPHPYGVGKIISEHYLNVYSKVYGMRNSIVRYFSIFGPRQRDDLQYAAVIPKFIGLGLKNEPLTVFGDGEQTRNFTFVKDAVKGTVLVADSPKAVGNAYNVASEEEISINGIVTGLSELFGRDLLVRRMPLPYKEPRRNAPDLTRIRALGYRQEYSFQEGLEAIYGWYVKRS